MKFSKNISLFFIILAGFAAIGCTSVLSSLIGGKSLKITGAEVENSKLIQVKFNDDPDKTDVRDWYKLVVTVNEEVRSISGHKVGRFFDLDKKTNMQTYYVMLSEDLPNNAKIVITGEDYSGITGKATARWFKIR